MSRAVIYCRISKDRSGLSANTGIQLRECRQYCHDQGWDIIAEYEENDISASRYSKKPRPLYQRLLGLVRDGKVDVIVATESERLNRRPDEMSTLIDLAERHPLRIALTNDDTLDLTDSNGIYRARTAVALAERESRKTSERMKRKKAARAAQGLPDGGRRPYGYLDDMVTINEPEAAVLREMGRRLLAGHGYNEIARWANKQGHVTATGKQWYGITVANYLRKARYAGIRTHLGTPYPAVWPAVFDNETWERIQLSIKVREGKNVPKARKYLLTGILVCGGCGGTLNGSTKIDRKGRPKRRVYQCIQCRGTTRNAHALDHYVREQVISALDVPELAAMLMQQDDGQVRELLAERQVRQHRLDALVDDYASGLLNRNQFSRAKSTAEANLRDVEHELDKAGRESIGVELSAGESVRQAWERNNDDWRRRLLQLIVKRIVVNKGTSKPFYEADGVRYRFDPTLIDINWLT